MTDPRGRGGALVPLSEAESFRPGEETEANARQYRTRDVQYTEAGKAAADAFDTYTTENPRMRCETTSILFDWTFDGPVNRITQGGDTITLQYGQLGFTRTIHMDMTEHPANVAPSRAGHSIGRWEDDVLIVDTVGFAPGVLSPPIMNSAQLRVVERFSLNPRDDADHAQLYRGGSREHRRTIHGLRHDRRGGLAIRAGQVHRAHVRRLLARRPRSVGDGRRAGRAGASGEAVVEVLGLITESNKTVLDTVLGGINEL